MKIGDKVKDKEAGALEWSTRSWETHRVGDKGVGDNKKGWGTRRKSVLPIVMLSRGQPFNLVMSAASSKDVTMM